MGKAKVEKRRPSRRISQRLQKRTYVKLMRNVERNEAKKMEVFVKNEEDILSSHKHLHESTIKDCLNTYGFTANPSLPTWKNVENALCQQSPEEYFNRPSQMAFHNLCGSIRQTPKGIGTTLGLGLKFYVQTDQAPFSLEKSFQRFEKDMRTKVTFAGKPQKDTPKKIYVKSTDWVPDTAENHVEDRIRLFCKSISAENNFLRKQQGKHYNLTFL